MLTYLPVLKKGAAKGTVLQEPSWFNLISVSTVAFLQRDISVLSFVMDLGQVSGTEWKQNKTRVWVYDCQLFLLT